MATRPDPGAVAQAVLHNSRLVSVTVVTLDLEGRIEACTASNALCPLKQGAITDLAAQGVAMALSLLATTDMPERHN